MFVESYKSNKEALSEWRKSVKYSAQRKAYNITVIIPSYKLSNILRKNSE
jgi:hypothetical protein